MSSGFPKTPPLCQSARTTWRKRIENESKKRGLDVVVKRNGSRGMFFLEPLVEVETEKGRVAYGPVDVSDVASLFEGAFEKGGDHRLGLGLTEDIPYLKNQERLTFARAGLADPLDLDAYIANGGFEGLKKAIALEPSHRCRRSARIRPAWTRRRWVSGGH